MAGQGIIAGMHRPRLRRRDVIAGWLLSATAGCGWHAVYGGATAASPAVSGSLAAISVDSIPDRAGQLLQEALQARLAGSADEASRYALHASFQINSDALGIQQDSSVTRIRFVGIASYTLTALADRRTLTSGTARAVDGLDIANQQFFAQDLEQDAITRRLAQALAAQVALQLAVFFQQRAAA
jgi:LPS-assembly lipoprotein